MYIVISGLSKYVKCTGFLFPYEIFNIQINEGLPKIVLLRTVPSSLNAAANTSVSTCSCF